MKKCIIPIFIALFIYGDLAGQQYQMESSVVSLVENQSFYLNSRTRIGGRTRNYVKIELPENTKEWFITFSTSSKDNQLEKAINLASQLTRLISDNPYAKAFGLSAKAAYQIVKPTGIGAIDVYITDETGYEQFFATNLVGYWSNSKPEIIFESPRENIKDGTFHVDEVTSGTVYVCFKNPNATEGVIVTCEAAAVVTEEVYVDKWTSESINQLEERCYHLFGETSNAVIEVCECSIQQLSQKYKASEYSQFPEDKQAKAIMDFLESCAIQTNNHQLVDLTERIEGVYQNISGLVEGKAYASLVEQYEELLSLGIEDASIYNELAWYCLLTQQYDKAKAYALKGLSYDANHLPLKSRLAHHFLLTGDIRNAREIYLQHKKDKLRPGLKFKEHVQQDFELLESQGVYTPYFDDIRSALKIKG